MTNKFALIKALNAPEKEEILPKGIKYQHYDMDLENVKYNVYIPLREAGKFEAVLGASGKMTKDKLGEILKDFRGIME